MVPCIPIILAGGFGKRLWPLSRENKPKQFLPLCSEHSLLQETFLWLKNSSCFNDMLLFGNAQHRFLIHEQLQELNFSEDLIKCFLEPVPRNTAPTIALAALVTQKLFGDRLLLVLPSDHQIEERDKFLSAIKRSFTLAEQDYLVTFGIKPDKPHCGYGYIKRGSAINDSDSYYVEEFAEKPDLFQAEAYLKSGNYCWNSGVFVFSNKKILQEFKMYAPDILTCCEEIVENLQLEKQVIDIPRDLFEKCPTDSIDFSIMEKTQSAVVFPLELSWTDLGSWDELWRVSKKNVDGNVCHSDVISFDSRDCYLNSQQGLLVTLGVTDSIVINTKDATLVAHKDNLTDIKMALEILEQAQREELIEHSCVHRPWGYYQLIDSGDTYQVKRLVVKPYHSLSLQLHRHRSEHWIIVSGEATVTKNEEVFTLLANESTYIPMQMKHRLSNQKEIPLVVIEVQSGDYLGEDDIVRFVDDYDRAFTQAKNVTQEEIENG